ncbi:MAG: hypothetical protein A4E32_00525 [Methanomassiliicoccales archaeon PtaU1.Bin124]|nr:MAG: hypothetical protein A4E32_00525 [Methanomassiliicoccales archaeon PtaU1.Bin124]
MREMRRLRRLDISFIVIALVCLAIIALYLLKNISLGLVGSLDYAFGIVTVGLAVQGGLALWTLRDESQFRGRSIFLVFIIAISLAWVIAITTISMGWPLNIDLFNQWYITNESMSSDPMLIGLVWLICFGVGVLWFLGLVGAVRLLSRMVQVFLPRYLLDIKSVKFDKKDGLLKWAECWVISFPNMLEPSSLRLDPQEQSGKEKVGLFFQTITWQLVLGMLLAIYISLNPMLLSAMDFKETINLIYIPIGILPLFILPWAILDGLGAKVAGTRRDFYLHEGAKKRMMQTMITFGTLLLIMRLALIQIDVVVILINFIIVAFLLLILSLMASFAYFNYFEEWLIQDLKARYEKGN